MPTGKTKAKRVAKNVYDWTESINGNVSDTTLFSPTAKNLPTHSRAKFYRDAIPGMFPGTNFVNTKDGQKVIIPMRLDNKMETTQEYTSDKDVMSTTANNETLKRAARVNAINGYLSQFLDEDFLNKGYAFRDSLVNAQAGDTTGMAKGLDKIATTHPKRGSVKAKEVLNPRVYKGYAQDVYGVIDDINGNKITVANPNLPMNKVAGTVEDKKDRTLGNVEVGLRSIVSSSPYAYRTTNVPNATNINGINSSPAWSGTRGFDVDYVNPLLYNPKDSTYTSFISDKKVTNFAPNIKRKEFAKTPQDVKINPNTFEVRNNSDDEIGQPGQYWNDPGNNGGSIQGPILLKPTDSKNFNFVEGGEIVPKIDYETIKKVANYPIYHKPYYPASGAIAYSDLNIEDLVGIGLGMKLLKAGTKKLVVAKTPKMIGRINIGSHPKSINRAIGVVNKAKGIIGANATTYLMSQDKNREYGLGGGLQGGLGGAATGAQIGSMFGPGIGTAVGAIGGALIGGITSWLGEDKEDKLRKQQMTQQIEEQKKVEEHNKKIADTNNLQMYKGINGNTFFAGGGMINSPIVPAANSTPINQDAQLLTTPSGRTDLGHGEQSNGEVGDVPIINPDGNGTSIAHSGEVLVRDKQGNDVILSKKLGYAQRYIILNNRKQQLINDMSKGKSASELGTLKQEIRKIDFMVNRLIEAQKAVGNNGQMAYNGLVLPDNDKTGNMFNGVYPSYTTHSDNTMFKLNNKPKVVSPFANFEDKYNPPLVSNNFKDVDVSWNKPRPTLKAAIKDPMAIQPPAPPAPPSTMTKVSNWFNNNQNAISSIAGLAGSIMGTINNNNRLDKLLEASNMRRPMLVPYTAGPSKYDNSAEINSINNEYNKAIAMAKAEGKDITSILPSLMSAKIEALSKTNQNKYNTEIGYQRDNMNQANQRIGTNMALANELQNDKLSNLAGYTAQRSASDANMLNNILSFIKDNRLQDLDKDKLAILAQAYKSGIINRMNVPKEVADALGMPK